MRFAEPGLQGGAGQAGATPKVNYSLRREPVKIKPLEQPRSHFLFQGSVLVIVAGNPVIDKEAEILPVSEGISCMPLLPDN